MKNRRDILKQSTLAGLGISVLAASCTLKESKPAKQVKSDIRHNPIGVSSYSFWQFNGPKEDRSMKYCIDQAARMGFDGIEFLLVQMSSEETGHLNFLKKRLIMRGLILWGFPHIRGMCFRKRKKR